MASTVFAIPELTSNIASYLRFDDLVEFASVSRDTCSNLNWMVEKESERKKKNWVEKGFYSMLHKPKAVLYLLKTNDFSMRDLETALCLASAHGYDRTINILLAKGVDVNFNSCMALNRAARHGNLKAVMTLMKAGANPALDKYSSFMMACSGGYIEIVKFMVENGVDPRFNNGEALSRAISDGQVEVARYLVGYAFDIENLRSDVVSCIRKGNLEMIKFVDSLGFNFEEKSIVYAVIAGKIELVKYFVSKGIDPRMQDNTPFEVAVQFGYVEIAEYLNSL